MSLQQPRIDKMILKGGLDQITPTLSLEPGFLKDSLNFEASVTGGYSRVVGYERFDGKASPTDASIGGGYRIISVSSWYSVPSVGSSVTTTSGAAGVISYIDGLVVVVSKVSGTWVVGDALRVGTPVGTIDNVYGTLLPASNSRATAAVADTYRSDIGVVPGSGAIRGVAYINDTAYAFRNNSGGTAAGIYKSSASGWVNVPLYYTVSFTTGGATEPAEGTTLTKGGVTATVKRVVRTSGTWASNSAAGQLILTTPSGGTFSAGVGTIGGISVTLTTVSSQITMPAGGAYEFDYHNFGGQKSTSRVYGVNGMGKAFEFDGDILVPITTGAAVDKPTHVVCHKGFLFLSVGSSAMQSAPGLPYSFATIEGATELAVGDDITGMITLPGGTSAATLGIFSRNNTYILYGTGTADWNLIAYNTGTGAVPYTLSNMAQTYAFDDRGINSIQAALQYGNFDQSAISNQVLPFVTARIGMATCATLCRKKSQYRLFFNDGFGLFTTVVNNTLMGCMPVYYPDVVRCVCESKTSSGRDVIFFGSTGGYVFQAEKGTSFDGVNIPFNFTTSFSNSKSPRTLKRYRKAVPEVTSDSQAYAEMNFSYNLGSVTSDAAPATLPVVINSVGTSKAWDTGTWDSGTWDVAPTSALECPIDGTAENICLKLQGEGNFMSAFTINSFLLHYSPRRNMR